MKIIFHFVEILETLHLFYIIYIIDLHAINVISVNIFDVAPACLNLDFIYNKNSRSKMETSD